MTPEDIGRTIRNWWAHEVADRDSGAARGLSARLRRRTGIEILAEKPVQDLAAALHSRNADRLIRLVRVLAELRGTAQASLPRLLGQGDPKTISPARFQTLMRAEGDELTTALIRAIRALGPADARACAVAALARDLWLWDDQTRARWTFEYYAAPTPAALQPDLQETPA
ncbi:type I-E CRISPR-associated protein Cse2/CasB [Paracoccus sp. p4-l81]|uniref:type I-E CRISPR-associated protein Cse2/CasB n=1 Tax=unclassified Paracoccus (in: a-proteobacteria) TaxID=2688777 RepID=UPI0035B7F057